MPLPLATRVLTKVPTTPTGAASPWFWFAKAGANIITFHPEATRHVDRTLQLIRDHGCQAGLVFAFGWEQAVLLIPGYLKRLTVAYYLQALVPHAMPSDSPMSPAPARTRTRSISSVA